ncbi:MAG: hypothetical protein Q8N70_00585 [Deltaproteobacteria bacterium]|nr:hypothetical protein [Deltaproteobacteria bacterium]
MTTALENLPSPLFALRARGPMGRRLKRVYSSLWSPIQPPAQKSLWLGESGL